VNLRYKCPVVPSLYAAISVHPSFSIEEKGLGIAIAKELFPESQRVRPAI
jgi:hypothetical protein